jgi:hypothetical protein
MPERKALTQQRDALVRLIGYALAAAFALVGLLFLALPGDVLATLNRAGSATGLPEAPLAGHGFYLALAVAYMYVVTVLALLMARHPDDRAYPTILVHAKAASALLSVVLFAVHGHYFAYLANFAADATIALVVYWLCLRPDVSTSPRAAPSPG